MEKICGTCKTILTVDNAWPCFLDAEKKTRGVYCISCRKKYSRRRREVAPSESILNRAKGNAKIRGIEFSLELKDIPDIPEYCPVFPWIQLEYKVGQNRSWGTPSIDRIENSLGYIPGNVRIISFRANSLKNDAGLREFIALAEDAKDPKRNPIKELPVYIAKKNKGTRVNKKLQKKEKVIARVPVIEGRLIWDKPNQTWLHPETLQPLA